MVLGLAAVRSFVKMRDSISRAWAPDSRIIPNAPPGAVASAQIVSFIQRLFMAVDSAVISVSVVAQLVTNRQRV